MHGGSKGHFCIMSYVYSVRGVGKEKANTHEDPLCMVSMVLDGVDSASCLMYIGSGGG